MKRFAKFISADGLMARRRVYDRPPCIYLVGSDRTGPVPSMMDDPHLLRTVKRRYDLVASNRCGDEIIEYIYQENLFNGEGGEFVNVKKGD